MYPSLPLKDLEKRKAYKAEWYRKKQQDPKYRKERSSYLRAYRATDNGRDKYLQRTYGITLEEYNRLLAAQGGMCSICGTTNPGRGKAVFNVDHCHDTGTIRGLLCHSCNVGLGKFKDNPSLLLKASSYLGGKVQ